MYIVFGWSKSNECECINTNGIEPLPTVVPQQICNPQQCRDVDVSRSTRVSVYMTSVLVGKELMYLWLCGEVKTTSSSVFPQVTSSHGSCCRQEDVRMSFYCAMKTILASFLKNDE